MRLIKPSIEFLNMTPDPLQAIEIAGRTCYKSEDKITEGSAVAFTRKIMKNGYLAMIEHAWASYRVICDRGVSHEIVRHRLFSYAQESTRYCNYRGGATFIIPPWLASQIKEIQNVDFNTAFDTEGNGVARYWGCQMLEAEKAYKTLILKANWTPQQARSVLPNALKTELVITGNLHEWLHFFKLRTTKNVHPQMQEIANMLLVDIQQRIPIIFVVTERSTQ